MKPSPPTPDTEQLLMQARAGDPRAVEQLLAGHRQKLRQMVAVRMDDRLAVRVDPSDVVQDVLATAFVKLPTYLRDRPLAFYPWLRQLAWQRLAELHRQHVQARKRSVMREEPQVMAISEQSAIQLADRLAASQTSPSGQIVKREERQRVRDALQQLGPRDRELLVLIYLEQLSTTETSGVLGLSEKAITMRHLRALERLRRVLRE